MTTEPLTADTTLQPVRERGWRNGLANLLDKEAGLWFGPRVWLRRVLIWLLITNGLVPIIGLEARSQPDGLAMVTQALPVMFFAVGGLAMAGGGIILSQSSLIGEKQAGTAAWVLSKPASREAFVLAKFAATTIGMWVVALLVPAGVFYALDLVFAGHAFPLVPFLGAVGLLAVNTVFYVALAIMLGAIFSHRGPVLGLGLGFIFLGQVIPGFIKNSDLFFPWKLPEVAASLLPGAAANPSLPLALLPTVATLVWTALFVAVAVLIFRREEM